MKKLFCSMLLFCALYGNDSEEFFQKLSLTSYLNSFQPLIFEGHVERDQSLYLFDIINKDSNIKLVGEIGFNAGHSSEVFLASRNDIHVISFDIGVYDSVHIAKDYLDNLYPQRHTLIFGDSLVTVPQHKKFDPTVKFDLIFIDGGHTFKIAINDILNMKEFAHENTILIMDDLEEEYDHGKGPARAWETAKKQGIIDVIEVVTSSNGQHKWGKAKYNFTKKRKFWINSKSQ